jgi:hypothetical protein
LLLIEKQGPITIKLFSAKTWSVPCYSKGVLSLLFFRY